MRAGLLGLSLLADPLKVRVLKALEHGPLPLPDLREAVDCPPETTLRSHLREMESLGIVARSRERDFPQGSFVSSADSGRELMEVGLVLSDWLTGAPEGAVAIGSRPARDAVKALIEGWTTRMLRALAAKPLSLTELDRVIAGVSYPSLERRLNAMRTAGQIVAASGRNSKPYMLTRWLREAAAPVAAALRWEEGLTLHDCESVTRLDMETLLLLIAPRLGLPLGIDGVCRIEVTGPDDAADPLTAIVLSIKDGRLGSCRVDPSNDSACSIGGTMATWLEVLSGGDDGDLVLEGDGDLPHAIFTAIRSALRCRTSRARRLVSTSATSGGGACR